VRASHVKLHYFHRIDTDAQKGDNQDSFRYKKCNGYKKCMRSAMVVTVLSLSRALAFCGFSLLRMPRCHYAIPRLLVTFSLVQYCDIKPEVR